MVFWISLGDYVNDRLYLLLLLLQLDLLTGHTRIHQPIHLNSNILSLTDDPRFPAILLIQLLLSIFGKKLNILSIDPFLLFLNLRVANTLCDDDLGEFIDFLGVFVEGFVPFYHVLWHY